MDHQLPFDRAATPQTPMPAPMPSTAPETSPTGLLGMALNLMSHRRRARVSRDFRGFDRHQLRDLGITPLDLW